MSFSCDKFCIYFKITWLYTKDNCLSSNIDSLWILFLDKCHIGWKRISSKISWSLACMSLIYFVLDWHYLFMKEYTISQKTKKTIIKPNDFLSYKNILLVQKLCLLINQSYKPCISIDQRVKCTEMLLSIFIKLDFRILLCW